MDNIYFYMLNFTIVHEYGHIAHGHLREQKGEKSIDGVLKLNMDIQKVLIQAAQMRRWYGRML